LLYFGQHDHARFFGRDARARLSAPGFTVEEYTAVEPNVSRFGLSRGEKVFLCHRSAELKLVAGEAGVAIKSDISAPMLEEAVLPITAERSGGRTPDPLAS
jgi:hypothetical protein